MFEDVKFNIVKFGKKDDANAEYNKHRQQNIRPPYFSRDYHGDKKSTKLYFIIAADFYDKIDKEHLQTRRYEIQDGMWQYMIDHIMADKKNPHYYEMTDEGGNHIFGDIDGPPVKDMLKHCDGDIEKWMRKLNQYMISKIYTILGCDLKRDANNDAYIIPFVTDSSSDNPDGKFSRHVLYRLPCGQWFDSTQLVGSIINEIRIQWSDYIKSDLCKDKRAISLPDGTGGYKFPFDMQVYALGKSRCFRAVRSSKGHPDSINRFKLPVINGVKIPYDKVTKEIMSDYMVTYNNHTSQSFIPIKEQLLANYIAFGTKKRQIDASTQLSIQESFGNKKIQKLSDSQVSVNTINRSSGSGINIIELKKMIPQEQHRFLDYPKEVIHDLLVLLDDKSVHWYNPVQGIVCVGDTRKDCEIACQSSIVSSLPKKSICKGGDESRPIHIHKSNHIYWIVKLGRNGYIIQKCHDLNCVDGIGNKLYLKDISNPLVDKALAFELPVFTISTNLLF